MWNVDLPFESFACSNEYTFIINKIDSFSQVLTHSLKHNEIFWVNSIKIIFWVQFRLTHLCLYRRPSYVCSLLICNHTYAEVFILQCTKFPVLSAFVFHNIALYPYSQYCSFFVVNLIFPVSLLHNVHNKILIFFTYSLIWKIWWFIRLRDTIWLTEICKNVH